MITVQDILVQAVKDNIAKAAPLLPSKLGDIIVEDELVKQQESKFKMAVSQTMLQLGAAMDKLFPEMEVGLDDKPLASQNLWYWLYAAMGGDQPRANTSRRFTCPKVKVA